MTTLARTVSPLAQARLLTTARVAFTAWLWLSVSTFLCIVLIPVLTGIEFRTVLTGSMEPAVPRGALVVAVPASLEDVAVGDVVMFRQPGDPSRVITHRVTALPGAEEPGLKTRGDANNSEDPWGIGSDDLIGRVVLDVPHAGQVAEWIRSPLGMLLLLIIPCVWLLISELRVVYRFIRYGAAGVES